MNEVRRNLEGTQLLCLCYDKDVNAALSREKEIKKWWNDLEKQDFSPAKAESK